MSSRVGWVQAPISRGTTWAQAAASTAIHGASVVVTTNVAPLLSCLTTRYGVVPGTSGVRAGVGQPVAERGQAVELVDGLDEAVDEHMTVSLPGKGFADIGQVAVAAW